MGLSRVKIYKWNWDRKKKMQLSSLGLSTPVHYTVNKDFKLIKSVEDDENFIPGQSNLALLFQKEMQKTKEEIKLDRDEDNSGS